MNWVATTDEYFTLVQGQKPVVMIFSADWCPDCRYLDVFIDEVAVDYQDRLTFYKVNRDEFGELCETLDIMGIPSFVAYQDGKVIGRFVNSKRKSREEVEDFLNVILSKPH